MISGSLCIHWFVTRSTINAAIPDGTSLLIRFTPNKNSWSLIQDFLGNTPLVTGHSLTARDMALFDPTEFAIAISDTGESSLILRSPPLSATELFDGEGLVVTEVQPRLFVISSSLRPTHEEPLKTSLWRGIHIPFTQTQPIGSIHLLGDHLVNGSLSSTPNEVVMNLPKIIDTPSKEISTVPRNTLVYLSTPLLTTTNPLSLISHIETVMNGLGVPTERLFRSVTESGRFILTHSNGEYGTLVDFPIDASTQDIDDKHLLKTLAAAKTPQIHTFSLPDETEAEEIIVDPSVITLEEVTISGSPLSKTVLSEGRALFSTKDTERIMLTNREELVSFWLGKAKSEETEAPKCPSSNLYIHLSDLLETSSTTQKLRYSSVLESISATFPFLGVEAGKRRTVIRFCKDVDN